MKNKIFISCILAVCLIVSILPVAAESPSYLDILNEALDLKFDPNHLMTREEFFVCAAMLFAEPAENEDGEDYDLPFADVDLIKPGNLKYITATKQTIIQENAQKK